MISRDFFLLACTIAPSSNTESETYLLLFLLTENVFLIILFVCFAIFDNGKISWTKSLPYILTFKWNFVCLTSSLSLKLRVKFALLQNSIVVARVLTRVCISIKPYFPVKCKKYLFVIYFHLKSHFFFFCLTIFLKLHIQYFFLKIRLCLK